jgi:hypothetical protein
MAKKKQFTMIGLLSGNIQGCHRAIELLLQRKKNGYQRMLRSEFNRGQRLLEEFKSANLDPQSLVAKIWYERCEADIKVLEPMLEKVLLSEEIMLENCGKVSNFSSSSHLHLL